VLMLLYILTNSVNAIQVVQEESQQAQNEGVRAVIITVLSILFIVFLFSALIMAIVFVMIKIYQKLSDYKRKAKDYLYYDFEYQIQQCHINRDYELKYRNPRRFWIFWNRLPVYIDTKDEGLKFVGMYQGETKKKEGIYMIALYNKLSIFKYVEQIVLVPYSLKSYMVKKIHVGKNKALILEAEGIDNVGNTDYYYIPLIKDNTKREKEFIDFADYIHREFFESIIYRDVIKTNLQQYREGVIKSVETNPSIHFKRRGE